MRPLGPGVVVVPALLPWLSQQRGDLPVVEVEPQTLSGLRLDGDRRRYLLNRDLFGRIVDLPNRKLVHSVGLPFGGPQPAEPEQIGLIAEMSDALGTPWISDHLSFNAFRDGEQWANTGFFLPPRQTEASAQAAARKIRRLANALAYPVAFETGVNYLRPHPDEMSDGEFFGRVARLAGSGLLLDLHNLWVNERNGRQSASDVLAALPLDRVWELHLAGGTDLNGFALDAHSGPVPEGVWELAEAWVSRMPNLGAIIFEVLDDHASRLGGRVMDGQWDRLRALWARRAPADILVAMHPGEVGDSVDPHADEAWERHLAEAVIGRAGTGGPGEEADSAFRGDPGIALFRELIFDTRAGFVAQGLRYSMTLLLSALGPRQTRDLLAQHAARTPPSCSLAWRPTALPNSCAAVRQASNFSRRHWPTSTPSCARLCTARLPPSPSRTIRPSCCTRWTTVRCRWRCPRWRSAFASTERAERSPAPMDRGRLVSPRRGA